MCDWLKDLVTWASRQDTPSGTDISAALLSTITLDTFWTRGGLRRGRPDAGLHYSALSTASFWCLIDSIAGNHQNDECYRALWHALFPILCTTAFASGRAVAISPSTPKLESVYYLVPGCTKPGDVVAVFVGLPIPFVLRPAELEPGQGGPAFRIVGSAYAHGLMDGQIFSKPLPEQVILLK